MKKNHVLFVSIFILLISSYASFSAPVGSWENIAFSSYFIANNNDPDGLYLPSAVEYSELHKFPFYLGTPGVTFHFSLFFLSKAYHFLSFSKLDFIPFCAKNWLYLNLITKIFCSFVFSLVFYIIYKFGLKIGLDSNESFLAACFYILSFPVLMYINKISPEGLMMLFSILCLYFLFLFEDTYKYSHLLYSGASCGIALTIKIHYIFFLPLFCIFYLFIKHKKTNRISLTLSQCVFCVSFLCFFLGLFHFVELDKWMAGWRSFINNYAYHGSSLDEWKHFDIKNILSTRAVLLDRFVSYFNVILDVFLFHIKDSDNYLFFMSSLAFYVLSLIGLAKYWKQTLKSKFFLCSILCSLPILVFRLDFHYFFFVNFLLSLFCAKYVANYLLKTKSVQALIIIVFIVSWPSIFVFCDKTSHDILNFQSKFAPYYKALNLVNYGEKVGVLGEKYFNTENVGGFYPDFGITPNLRLLRKFTEQFINIDNINQATLYRYYIFSAIHFNKDGSCSIYEIGQGQHSSLNMK